MKVRIHDLSWNPTKSYTITDPAQAHDSTDRAAAEEAFASGEVITMGVVIAEPVFED